MRIQCKPLSGDAPAPDFDIALDGLLRGAGLRATAQRVSLAALLFADRGRHVTAEGLYREAIRAGMPVSLATVYNSLNKFAKAGLLRQVPVGGHTAHFDTNTSNHPHFLFEHQNLLLDIPDAEIALDKIPAVPAGYEFVGMEIVVRLTRKER